MLDPMDDPPPMAEWPMVEWPMEECPMGECPIEEGPPIDCRPIPMDDPIGPPPICPPIGPPIPMLDVEGPVIEESLSSSSLWRDTNKLMRDIIDGTQ